MNKAKMKNLIKIFFVLFLVGIAPQSYSDQNREQDRSLRLMPSTGKRIALVIGNGNYQFSDSLPKLSNPTHDAEDISAALRKFGFEVIERKNQTKEDMDSAISEFSRKLGDSEAALFYFAGHGLQVKGQNFIVPVDAKIETEAQIPYKSINVNEILDEMDNGKSRVNIVMLDACRNNPISGKFRSGATRGLAAPATQPKGTIIVYATDPGNVAADGNGRNGLFTQGLLTAFGGNDLSLHGVLVRASKEVERGSDKKQTPYINGPATLQEEFRFALGQNQQVANIAPVPVIASPATHVKSRDEIEQDGWESARESANVEVVREYLKQYPKGRFAGQAKILIATLKAAPAKGAESIASPVREDNETVLWNEVQKGNSIDDYDAYLAQYPKGKYVALAKSRSKKLQEQASAELTQQDQSAWDTATALASEESYQDYLRNWATGRYVGLAQARLHKLQADSMLGVWDADEVVGKIKYTGQLRVDKKLSPNSFEGVLEFSYSESEKNKRVRQIASINKEGNNVTISCRDPVFIEGAGNFYPDHFSLTSINSKFLKGSNKDANGTSSEIIFTKK